MYALVHLRCVYRLATRKPEQTFGALIRNFVECTLNGCEKNPHTVLSNVSDGREGIVTAAT